MAGALKKVVFIGAAGSIGTPVFKHLQKAGLELSVLSRASSETKYPDNVNVIKAEYDDSDLAEKLKGQDALVSLSSAGAIGAQAKLIEAAVEAGIKRYIPSEFGSNTLNETAQDLVFIYKQKLAILEQLKEASKKNESFTWTGIATGPVFDWCIVSGFLGYSIKDKTALIYDSGDNKFSATNCLAIAQAIEAILKKPESTADKYIYLSSFTITQNEVLAALEKATGGDKWKVTKASTEEGEREGKEKMARGDFSGIRSLLARLMFGGGTGGNFEEAEGGPANKGLGLPEEDLDETCKLIVEGKLP